MKHLIIDGQLYQVDAWNRGMGKLTIEFLERVIQGEADVKSWKITLVLNENLRNEARTREIAARLHERAEIVYMNLITPQLEGASYGKALKANAHQIEKYLEGLSGDKIFFMPALLEHFIYPVFPGNAKKILFFHDLIPLLFAERALHNEDLRRSYFERFTEIFKADLIMANSETTRADLITYLSLPPSSIKTVYGGGFSRDGLTPSRPKMPDGRPFVLLPSGDDFRKNNIRCVEAFAEFNRRHNSEYQLVVTSRFSVGTIERLRNISPDVHFVGSVSDEELKWLYSNAQIVFFGTEYEGLGMPLLEAMGEGCGRIVCSDIPVFRELIKHGEALMCDPYSVEDMALALDRSVTKDPIKNYPLLEEFTWERASRLFAEALLKLAKTSPKTANLSTMPKIAIVCPDPRGHSSIGKFAQELHPELYKAFQCDYYFENSELTPELRRASYLPYVANCYSVNDLNIETYSQYDAVWYHLGNSDYHIETAKRALVLPGHIIFHDTRLRGLYDQLVQRGHISPERYRLEESLKGWREAEFIGSFVNSSKGIITHSKDAETKVAYQLLARRNGGKVKTPHIYHPMTQGPDKPKRNRVTIGFGGFATPRPDDIGFKLLLDMLQDKRYENCAFEVFGASFNFQRNPAMGQIRTDGRVTVTGDPSDYIFQSKLAKTDILINYRPNYFGETSRFTLEAMRHGAVAVVHDIGWYHELPDKAACKVKNQDDILTKVAELVADPVNLDTLSRNAREYVERLNISGYIKAMHETMKTNLLKLQPKVYRQEWLNGIEEVEKNPSSKIKEALL